MDVFFTADKIHPLDASRHMNHTIRNDVEKALVETLEMKRHNSTDSGKC